MDRHDKEKEGDVGGGLYWALVAMRVSALGHSDFEGC